MGEPKHELPSLTPLRGIAALVVMAYHLGFLTANSRAEMPVLLGHGYLAVDLFFLLSGFVLMHVYGTTFSRQVAWADIRVFLWARFARLYPVHLLVLITMLPGYGGIPGGSGANLLMSLLLLQGPWLDDVVWNASAWSISVECHAYIVFPLVALFTWNLSGRLVASMMVFCLAALAAVVGLHGDASISYGPLCLVRGLSEFIAGILLYRCRCAGWLDFCRHDIAFILSGSAAIISASFRGTDILTVVFLGALLATSAMNTGYVARLLNTGTPVFLGRISYSLYMVHCMIIVSVADAMIRVTDISASILLMTASAAALGAATLVSRCVEYPARDLLRRIVDRGEKTEITPAVHLQLDENVEPLSSH